METVDSKGVLAEEVGFEPTVPVRVQRFSRPPPSTTRPLLRWAKLLVLLYFIDRRVPP